MNVIIREEITEVDLLITQQAKDLSAMLHEHRLEMFPPNAQKTLRPFQLSEAAQYLNVTSGYLKNLSLEGKGPQPMVTPSGRRSYTAVQLLEMRQYLDRNSRAAAKYVPHRRGTEHLQIIEVVNFKGGSAKTTTAAHLAKPLALNLKLVDDSSVVLDVAVPGDLFANRDTCFSRSTTRRFKPAISERYCAEPFRRPSSSLRISLRANRTISSFKMDAMFGISVLLGKA